MDGIRILALPRLKLTFSQHFSDDGNKINKNLFKKMFYFSSVLIWKISYLILQNFFILTLGKMYPRGKNLSSFLCVKK